MKKKRKRNDDPFYNLEKAASATECTGLKSMPLQTAQEDEELSALYAIHDTADK